VKLFYKQINLPFQYTFTISRGRGKTHQPSLIVALQLGSHIGYGEAPAIAYYNITVDQMVADLESKKTLVEKICFYRSGKIFGITCIICFRKILFLFARWIWLDGICLEK
jgi:hypothetical protein